MSLSIALSPGINEIIGMPSEWVWTSRRLGHTMSEVYLVYSSESNDNRLGAMKLYRHSSNLESMRARRELLALQALKIEFMQNNNGHEWQFSRTQALLA
ncbi:unnamed protein product [Rotaria magnacalcarata]|uniref:Uncharacterized protein n=1 Tax=Rotaria magnacalcarata TaxID=392030 RepID=A0A8S3GQI6_9BILA|nr:unnamed protein product [Rotaria magnacalcarata]